MVMSFQDHLPSAAKSTGSMFALTEQDLVAAEVNRRTSSSGEITISCMI